MPGTHFLNQRSKFLPACFFLGLPLLFFFTECRKNDDNLPANSTGKITGVVLPAQAAFVVRATSSTGSVSSGEVDYTGHFILPNLLYGTYSLQAYPRGGYAKPPKAIVVLNQPVVQDTIEAPAKADDGKMDFTINAHIFSKYYPATRAFYVSEGKGLYIQFNTYFDPVALYEIYISVANVGGPGSYPIDDDPDFNCQILKRGNNGNTVDSVWSTFNGGSGVVTINSMDTLSRRISGTFSVTVMPVANYTVLPLTVSDGVFDNLYYE